MNLEQAKLQQEKLLKKKSKLEAKVASAELSEKIEEIEDQLLALMQSIQELEEAAGGEEDALSPGTQEGSELAFDEASMIIKSKGLSLELAGGLLLKKFNMAFMSAPSDPVEEISTKGMKSRKRTMEDYRPDEEELAKINSMSNVDISRDQVYVFEFVGADTVVDRGYEKFHPEALQDMAEFSVDKPLQLDHRHETSFTKGKIFDASVKNKTFRPKAYIKDSADNELLIGNIMMGITNKVSVGFGIGLTDYMCNSCGQPMVSKSCMHRPGSMDEKGAMCTATIKRVKDFYELSVVPVPMQPAAGIRRDFEGDIMEKSKSLDAANLGKDLEAVVIDVETAVKDVTANPAAVVVDLAVVETAVEAVVTDLTKEAKTEENPFVPTVVIDAAVVVQPTLADNMKALGVPEDLVEGILAELATRKIEEDKKKLNLDKILNESEGDSSVSEEIKNALIEMTSALNELKEAVKELQVKAETDQVELKAVVESNKSLESVIAKAASISVEDARREGAANALAEQKSGPKKGSYGAALAARFAE